MGDIMKYFLICAGILFIWATINQFRVNALQNEVNKLEINNKTMQTQIGRMQNAEKEASKTIAALRKVSAADKKSLDWYRHPVPADVLAELQKRHNRH